MRQLEIVSAIADIERILREMRDARIAITASVAAIEDDYRRDKVQRLSRIPSDHVVIKEGA